jgi:methionine biosynthesis protein MetW
MKTIKNFYQKNFARNLGKCDRLKKVKNIFKELDYVYLLDIGCGDGSFTLELRKNKDTLLYGVDISKRAIRLAGKKGIKGKVIDLNEDKLPFPSSYFDAIYCGEVLEHLYNPDLVLKEIWRVLKPRGNVVITTPNLSWWINRIALLLGYQPYLTEVSLYYDVGKFGKSNDEPSGHLRCFTPRALSFLLKFYKFRIVSLTTSHVTVVVPLLLKPFELLVPKIRPTLGHSIIVVAQPEK